MNKTFRILEIVWLVMAIVGVFMSGYNLMTGDKYGAIYFLVFTFVAGLMYGVRRRQRIKHSQKEKELQK